MKLCISESGSLGACVLEDDGEVPKERSVMVKGLRFVQQISSSSQGVHLL